MTQTYVQIYLQQSCGEVKICELACDTQTQAQKLIANQSARFPHDLYRFDVRTVNHK